MLVFLYKRITFVVITTLCLLYIATCINGYTIVRYINTLLPNTKCFHSTRNFKSLRQHWKDILNEYNTFVQTNYFQVKRFREIDQQQSKHDLGPIPWKVLILRIYNKDTHHAHSFPLTMKLIENLKDKCSLIMFSILPPGKKLASHRGPYKGLLRYHLALQTAQGDNAKKCTITIENSDQSITKYWECGKDLLFDDTYIHSVHNNTNETRIILFLDVYKEFSHSFYNNLNKIFMHSAQYHPTIEKIVSQV